MANKPTKQDCMPTKQDMEEWFRGCKADASGKVECSELRAQIKSFHQSRGTPPDDAAIAQINADLEVTRRSGSSSSSSSSNTSLTK